MSCSHLILNGTALKNSTAIGDKEKNLGESLEKLSGETITKKEKKLHRDQKAFTNNKAYLWPNFQAPRRPRPYASSQVHNRMARDRSVSELSVSSVLSHSSSFFPQRTPNTHRKDIRNLMPTKRPIKREDPNLSALVVQLTRRWVMMLHKHNFTLPTLPNQLTLIF